MTPSKTRGGEHMSRPTELSIIYPLTSQAPSPSLVDLSVDSAVTLLARYFEYKRSYSIVKPNLSLSGSEEAQLTSTRAVR